MAAVHAFISHPLHLRIRSPHSSPSAPTKRKRKQSPTCTQQPPPSTSSQPLNSPTNLFLVNAVPFLWGSYAPIAKLFLTVNPVPIPFLNFASYVTALSVFALPRKQDLPLLKGAELGSYLFFGSYVFLFSLTQTTASRAAFFCQLTTVFVPLLRAALGERLRPSLYAASILALFGVGIFTGGNLTGGLNTGDLLASLSALIFSIHVLRLEVLSTPDAIGLVQAKTCAQTVLSILALAITPKESWAWLQTVPMMPASELLPFSAGIFYLGAATTSLATWMQVVGQQRVGPTRCAIYYSSQPIYAAILAQLLNVDSISRQEVLGGFFIILSALVVAFDNQETPAPATTQQKPKLPS